MVLLGAVVIERNASLFGFACDLVLNTSAIEYQDPTGTQLDDFIIADEAGARGAKALEVRLEGHLSDIAIAGPERGNVIGTFMIPAMNEDHIREAGEQGIELGEDQVDIIELGAT